LREINFISPQICPPPPVSPYSSPQRRLWPRWNSTDHSRWDRGCSTERYRNFRLTYIWI